MYLDNPPQASTPLFGVLVRFMQFLQHMYVRRVAWSLADAAAELEVSPRTIRRYVEIAKILLTDGEGRPLLVLEIREGRTWIVWRAYLLPFESLVRH